MRRRRAYKLGERVQVRLETLLGEEWAPARVRRTPKRGAPGYLVEHADGACETIRSAGDIRRTQQ